MKIIYAGVTPYDCPLFDFEENMERVAAQHGIECHFLADSPLKLPWQLKEVLGRAESGEKVIVHTSSPFGVVAVSDLLSIGAKVKPQVVFMPKDTEDAREFKRYGKYASQVAVTLVTDKDHAVAARKEWGADVDVSILTPPAVAATGTLTSAEPRLLFQGEITRDSHLDVAVKILGDNPSMTMVVNGTGKGRWAMPVVRLSRTLGTEPRISWNSNDRDSTVEACDSNTTVLVPEPASPWQRVVIASYMLAGAVVVALDCSASRQLIDDGVNGIIVDAFDRPQLERAIGLDSATRSSIAQSAASHAASTYSVDNFFNELMSIYRSL